MKPPRRRRWPHRVRVLCSGDDVAADDLMRDCDRLEVRQSGVALPSPKGQVFLKGGPLSRRGARRHALRRLLLRAPAPCEAEYRNLTWLRERLFRAAEPLGAVTESQFGIPRRELLLTRAVPAAPPFDEAAAGASPRRRAELFAELGREVGRMHALRFLHADLYPRNVLAAAPCPEPGPGYGRSLVWLDTWAGGPTAWRRGSLRRVEDDLGAWFSLAADWMGPGDDEALLTSYVRARSENGRPLKSLGRFVRSVQQSRRRELSKLEREPRRLRGKPFPIAGWDPDVGRLEQLLERPSSIPS